MSKDTGKDEKKNLKPSSDEKYNNITDVEKLVDIVIQKNKEKLEKLYENEDFNDDRFSLKNKKGNTLFYMKKSKKKQEESKIFSGKIIAEARTNLGEEPINDEVIIEKPQPGLNKPTPPIFNDKPKKRFRFGKKDENDFTEKKDPIISKTEDLMESEDFDKVLYEIEKSPKIDVNKDYSDVEKQIDETIKHEPVEIKTKDDSVIVESKAKELVKKRRLFNRDKPSDEKIQEHIPKKNLGKETNNESTEDLKNKYGDAISFVDENEERIDNDLKLVDEQIKAAPKQEDTNLENELEKKEPEPDLKEKKSFFGKEKTLETIDEKQPAQKPSDEPIVPRFRVENIPTTEDEDQIIINQNIKNKQDSEKAPDGFEIGEEKAQKLAEKHLQEKPKKQPKSTLEFSKNKNVNDEQPVQALRADPLDDHEHVFFDEDAKFSGWSPHQSDKDKKELAAKPEIGDGDELGEIRDIELPKEILDMKSVKLEDLGFSEKEWEELDFYPLHEPFAYVEVLREKDTLEKCYFLVEVDLTEEEDQTMGFINDTIKNLTIDTEDLENTGNDDYLANSVNLVIDEYNLKINEKSMDKILYYLAKSSLGLDKIDPLMKDPNIEDISCDGSGVPLFLYHRKFGSLKSNVKFESEDELSSFVYKLAQRCGKHISIAEPMLDATMPDGSRIQMTLSDEITARGSTFTIRKFRSDPFSPPDLIEFNTMSAEMIAYMWLAVENGINMLFAGGTASGKTTTLNALSLFIPPESKIVSIEETRELNLPHPNWIPGVARTGFGQVVSNKMVGEIDMYDLMKAALRQRPEYILVGEIRGREAYVLFQAMATGHATYSTVHADSAHSLIHRLEGKPINIPRVMLQSLDVVSLHVITKVRNKRARRCKQIIEIIDIDPTTKEILTNEVFRWDPVEDKFVYSGKSYVLERIRAEKDLSREAMTDELKKRKKVVELMNQNNIREFRDVARYVTRYLDDPENILSLMDKELKKQ